MKACIIIFCLISTLQFASCSRKCCSEPKGFSLNISYKTKEGKNLFTFYPENDKGRYDTRKVEVYKVINNNNVTTNEPLDSWVKLREAYGNVGYSGLALKLPTDDKRVSRLLIYLYPTAEVDTISYSGEGKYNYPEIKNLFYNGTCIEKLNAQYLGGSPETVAYKLTITKPD